MGVHIRRCPECGGRKYRKVRVGVKDEGTCAKCGARLWVYCGSGKTKIFMRRVE